MSHLTMTANNKVDNETGCAYNLKILDYAAKNKKKIYKQKT